MKVDILPTEEKKERKAHRLTLSQNCLTLRETNYINCDLTRALDIYMYIHIFPNEDDSVSGRDTDTLLCVQISHVLT